jgi:large subunit ribosomal protein L3
MPAAIIGRKIGMTRYFTEEGRNVPVTVIQAGPCHVTQIKTTASDGYAAIQIAMEDVKPRRSNQAIIGHDAKAGVGPQLLHREVRLDDDGEAQAYQLGQVITVAAIEPLKFVDVVGTSKGKGFQGAMVRHHFKGLFASHGTERKHRSPGSIGSHATDRGHGAKIKKGKKMAGHMGDQRVTARSLDVIAVDADRNLLLVKGPVPGPNTGIVFVRASRRLYKSKARIQAGEA